MRELNRILRVFLIAPLATLAAAKGADAPAQPDARRVLLELGRAWVAAEDARDAATVRRLLDDKFVYVSGTHGVVGKDAFVDRVAAVEVGHTQTQTLTDETIVIDGDTAVVTGTDTMRGTNKGAPFTMTGRYTVTYIHRGSRWVALAEQLAITSRAP